MKKLLIVLLSCILSSCAVTTTTVFTIGNVSLLNTDGELIEEWNDAVLETAVSTGGYVNEKFAIKSGGGIVFTDSDNEDHYISGGIIIVDNIHQVKKSNTQKIVLSRVNGDDDVMENERAKSLVSEYNRLKAQLKKQEEIMSKAVKGSSDYSKAEEKAKKLKEKMSIVVDALKKDYNYEVTVD